MLPAELRDFLDAKAEKYNRPDFIATDPIAIPHLFKKKQDVEIAGLFAATLAWGQRPTIIRKSRELMERMDDAPYEFVRNATEAEITQLKDFRHRTFNGTDLAFFIAFLQTHYLEHESLEDLFVVDAGDPTVEKGIARFSTAFENHPRFPRRTRKHVSTPARKSACKRLNMFLRWMVRDDNCGVDFGIWKRLAMHQLVCPCDLHVERVARKLGLMRSKQLNWSAAVELTDQLRSFDAKDPVKYDFALFGLGIEEKF